jgi:hypothetical protein
LEFLVHNLDDDLTTVIWREGSTAFQQVLAKSQCLSFGSSNVWQLNAIGIFVPPEMAPNVNIVAQHEGACRNDVWSGGNVPTSHASI